LVEQNFFKSIDQVEITKIERIQNKQLWKNCAIDAKEVNEKYNYHRENDHT